MNGYSFLIPDIEASPGRIAPEKLQELRKLGAELDFVVEPSLGFACRSVPERWEVMISLGAVEVLWAFAYASYRHYEELFAGSKAEGQSVDIGNHNASRLLSWAMEKLTSTSSPEWPVGLPTPSRFISHGSTEHVAQELALVATGFLLLHEVGHCHLQHYGGDDRLDQERDADYWAWDWVFSGCPLDSKTHEKRGVGVAIALMLETARGIVTGDFGGRSHPRSFDRMLNCLDRHVGSDDKVWAFVVAMLAVHCGNAGINPPTQEYETFRDCVEGYMDILAENWL